MSEFQYPESLDWFDRRTFGGPNPQPFTTDANWLADVKLEKGLRPSVSPHTLDEQTTLGGMCRRIRRSVAVRVNQEVIERLPMAGVSRRM